MTSATELWETPTLTRLLDRSGVLKGESPDPETPEFSAGGGS